MNCFKKLQKPTTAPCLQPCKALRGSPFLIFQDIYTWSGEFRNTYLARGTCAFAAPEFIIERLGRLSDRIQCGDYFRGMDKTALASKLGQVLVELNNIHPFREGNGRTQRVFLSQLALQAGFELSFVHMTEVRMRNASIAGHRGDARKMVLYIADGLERCV